MTPVRAGLPAVAVLLAMVVLVGWGDARPAAGQQAPRARVAVLADTIRVGDVVPVAVRITVAADTRVAFPDTLAHAGADVENTARVRVLTDSLPDGRVQRTAVYSVTAWRPGSAALPDLELAVGSPGAEAGVVRVAMPPLEVVSVLPEDTVGLEPRPARGVIGPSWAWWPFVLLALAFLALAAAAWWWLRRRRAAAPAVVVPAVPPRERALAALRDAREAGHAERGEWKELYTRIAAALRGYLHDLDPGWSEDLTTTEILARIRERVGPREAAALASLLRPADQVKFARFRPASAAALAELEEARRWVERFDGPSPVQDAEVAA